MKKHNAFQQNKVFLLHSVAIRVRMISVSKFDNETWRILLFVSSFFIFVSKGNSYTFLLQYSNIHPLSTFKDASLLAKKSLKINNLSKIYNQFMDQRSYMERPGVYWL